MPDLLSENNEQQSYKKFARTRKRVLTVAAWFIGSLALFIIWPHVITFVILFFGTILIAAVETTSGYRNINPLKYWAENRNFRFITQAFLSGNKELCKIRKNRF